MKWIENIVEKGETSGKGHIFILLHFLVFKTILSLSRLGWGGKMKKKIQVL